MTEKKKRIGALFDLDGVLIDSETLYTKFWEKVGRERHLPSPTFAYDIKGTTLQQILDTYFAEPEAREYITNRIHEFEDEVVYPLFPGVIEFLNELRSKGVLTAIVTSSDDVKMHHFFGQHPDFGKYFDAIVTATDVTHSKPHPEPYLVAAEKLGCDPADCYVFEDSFQGLESGRRAGAKVIGIATTNPRESLKGKADLIIDEVGGFSYEKMMRLGL